MRFRAIAATAALSITATIAPAPTAGASHWTPSQVKALIMDVFGPVAGPQAIRIAACESTFDPHARHRNRNGTVDYGLFQLNSGGTLQSLGLTPNEALDPHANVAAAYRLFRKRGWQPWVCSRLRRHR